MKQILFLLCLLPLTLIASIINIPADYITIQEGIDVAVEGDSVLVHPGTYLENLDMSNKSGITLCSLEATTGDTTYISTTIIDGSLNETSTILCYENVEECVIRGISITGGKGYIYHSNDDTNDWQVFGGGILIFENCEISLINLKIFDNRASQGGGICFGYEDVLCTMSNVNIFNNIGRFLGGGVCFSSSNSEHSEVTFDQINRCSIYNNYSPQGMDIGWSFNRGFSIDIYLDMFTWYEPNRYFVNNYDYYYLEIDDIYPVFDFQQSYLTPTDTDYYVSMTGDDNNTGLTPDDPFRTTWKAFQQLEPSPDNPRTVHLLEGDFHEMINGHPVSIVLKDNTRLQGVSPEETRVLAENMVDTPVSGAISMGNYQDNMIVKDLSITAINTPAMGSYTLYNSTVENIEVYDCDIEFGVFKFNSHTTDLLIKDVIFHDNTARWGIILYTYMRSISLDNVLMYDNIAGTDVSDQTTSECGMYDLYAIQSITIKNSTFINNYHYTDDVGWATFRHLRINSSPTLLIENSLYANNITAGNAKTFKVSDDFSEVVIANNTFANNEGVYTCFMSVRSQLDCYNNIFANNTGYWYQIASQGGSNIDNCLFTETEDIQSVLEGNPNNFGSNNLIGTDPLFVGGDPAFPEYYYLSGDDTNSGPSPAIDAGTTDLTLFPTNYSFPDRDLANQRRIYGDDIDIGCYEFPGFTHDTDDTPSYTSYSLSNYPNPFNPTTTINYSIPRRRNIELAVFNVKGQRIKTLINDVMPSGEHSVIWDGDNDNGVKVASGIYFYKLQAGTYTKTKKMILMK